MKRPSLLIALAVLFLPSVCWAQIPENEHYPNGNLKVKWHSEFNDNDLTRTEYYFNGNLKNEARYEDGKIDGVYRAYGASNNIVAELNYKNGVQDGIFKEYSEKGTLLKEGSYRDGKLTGTLKIYDDSGYLYQEMEYTDDLMNGMAKVYYSDGAVKEELPYVNGELTGLTKVYDDNGRLKAEHHYEGNLRQGIAKEYYPSGSLRVKMNFVNDRIDGELVEYYENGQVKTSDVIAFGEIVERKAYDEQGALIKELSFNANEPKKKDETVKQKNRGNNKKIKLSRGLFGILQGTRGEVAVIVLLFVFLLSGLFIGNTLNITKKQDEQTKKNNIVKPSASPKSIRREFNVLNPESEKMYRSLVETVKSGIFMSDANGNLFYVNHTFAEIFGCKTKQEVIGWNLNDKFKSIDNEENQLLKVMGESNDIHDFQFKYRMKDNAVAVLSVSANRIFGESGEAIGLQGVVFDVTEKSQLEEDVLNEKKKLESILSFFEGIDSIHEFENLMDFGVKGIANILESYVCVIMLQEEDKDVFTVKGSKGADRETLKTIQVDHKDPIIGPVIITRKPLFVENIEYDKALSHVTRPSFLGRSFIITPLEHEDKVNGVVIVTDKRVKFQTDVPFDETDLKILTIIAGKVSIALDNLKLYEELNVQSVIDPITKIYNYRLLSESLDREISRFQREESQFYIFMMDIDDFKSYNDTYGHLEGDELLTNLGKILNEQVRKTDIVCRYAGDEFCIVLANTDLEGAIKPAEKIIKAVEKFKFKRKVTVSIGIAGYKAGMTKKDLIGKADEALYRAKHAGKNKIIINSQ